MTGIYSTSMGIIATIASGISYPLTIGMELGWQLSLLIWVIPVVIALVIWLFIYRQANQQQKNGVKFYEAHHSSGIWKSKLAWKVATFMGLQSLIFYVTISWLPEMLISFGMSESAAGFMLSYFQFVGIPASFIIPVVAGKLSSQAKLIVIINIGYIIGIVLLLLTHSFMTTIIAVTIIGISSGSNFALALTLLSFRAKDKIQAAELSGMAQSFGYSLAAIGPVLIGYLYDLTHTWIIPLILLIGIALLIIYFGFYAGQNKYVLE